MSLSSANRTRLSLLSALALTLLCLTVATRASAQFIPSVGLHGYLTERVSFNADTDFDAVRLDGRSGFHVGFDVRTSKKMLYLQPGLHYYRTKDRGE